MAPIARPSLVRRAGDWLRASHPIVFAAFPILALYSASLSAFPLPLTMALRPVPVAAAATVMLVQALRLRYPDLQHRAVLASMLLIGTQSFVLTATYSGGALLRSGLPDWVLAVAHLGIGTLLAASAGDHTTALRLAPPLRIAAGALVLTSAMYATAAEWRSTDHGSAIAAIRHSGQFEGVAGTPRPDIFHVVFDGLGAVETLHSRYGVHTARTVTALEQRGYWLARDARSNYAHTYTSMASMLNGSHLTPLSMLGENPDRRPLKTLIDTSTVMAALKGLGYRLTFVGSSYSATDRHPLADDEPCSGIGLNELESAVYRFSVLRLLRLDLVTYGWFRTKIRCQLESLASVPDGTLPQYVFAHLILPHPPFAFDERGAAPDTPRPLFGMQEGSAFPGSREEYLAGYRAQATFVMSAIERLTAAVAARSRPAVVIIHGDHGPGGRFHNDLLERSDLDERFRIFLAIGGTASTAAERPQSLVNLYRTSVPVLRSSGMLPDDQYYSPVSKPYLFTRVTIPSR